MKLTNLAKASKEILVRRSKDGCTSFREKYAKPTCCDTLFPKTASLCISVCFLGLKKASSSVNSSGRIAGDEDAWTILLSRLSQASLQPSANSFLVLWPRHVRCKVFAAFKRSRSCWRCNRSCWAAATVFCVPEAVGVQAVAANGSLFWPDRFTWRGRREWPVKDWNIVRCLVLIWCWAVSRCHLSPTGRVSYLKCRLESWIHQTESKREPLGKDKSDKSHVLLWCSPTFAGGVRYGEHDLRLSLASQWVPPIISMTNSPTENSL